MKIDEDEKELIIMKSRLNEVNKLIRIGILKEELLNSIKEFDKNNWDENLARAWKRVFVLEIKNKNTLWSEIINNIYSIKKPASSPKFI